MKIEHDKVAFDWIHNGRNKLPKSRTPEWSGNFVSHLIPPIFESYAKILHQIEAHYKHIDQPLTPTENAILGIPTCEPPQIICRKAQNQFCEMPGQMERTG